MVDFLTICPHADNLHLAMSTSPEAVAHRGHVLPANASPNAVASDSNRGAGSTTACGVGKVDPLRCAFVIAQSRIGPRSNGNCLLPEVGDGVKG